MCLNSGMPDCLAAGQSGTGMKHLMMPGLVRYHTEPMKSGIFLVQYQTEIMNARMPMLALVCSTPMPSYGCGWFKQATGQKMYFTDIMATSYFPLTQCQLLANVISTPKQSGAHTIHMQ
jgi:hypothetical protein